MEGEERREINGKQRKGKELKGKAKQKMENIY